MRAGRLTLMLGAIALFGTATGRQAYGATLEGLLMPGPLSAAHSKLESSCSNCHNRSDRAQQAQLCSSCHKDIAADIHGKRGFHGKRPEIATAQCNACHSEHLGRNARITPAVAREFDHAKTDFPLAGAHRGAQCAGCHVAGKKFRDAPSGCVDCHRKAEPHEGKLGTDCAACHGNARWSEVRFDHGETRFGLQGAHKEIPCTACHAKNRWKATPTACASCHTADDVHRGQRGTTCADCHTQTSWRNARFDHAKDAGFALEGKHKSAACASCHRSGRFEDKLPRDCKGCHAAVDSHAGRMGNKCESCHDDTSWKSSHFVHERDTKFTLVDAHAKLQCHSCHVSAVTQHKPDQACVACHRAVDVHGSSLGKQCESCHGATAWRQDVRFEHDLTDFPLLGQHVAVPCAGCHSSLKFKAVGKTCFDCHKTDDIHRGNLGKDCASCHSPNAWNIWQFDHMKQSGFELSGAHARLQCNSCHRRPAGEARLSRDCAICHATDDIHLGQFGRRCASCHSTISFHRTRPQ